MNSTAVLLNAELARLHQLAADHAVLTSEYHKVLQQADLLRRAIETQISTPPSVQKQIKNLLIENFELKAEIMILRHQLEEKSMAITSLVEMNNKLQAELKNSQTTNYLIQLHFERVNSAYIKLCRKLESKMPGLSTDEDVWKHFWRQHDYYINTKADTTLDWKARFVELKQYVCGVHEQVKKLQHKVVEMEIFNHIN